MAGAVPAELRAYLDEIVEELWAVVGPDLLGVWLIGSAAQGAYEHGLSDVDVVAVTGDRWPVTARAAFAARIVHPALECPTVGLECVWYALPDLTDLADPVVFQVNVNGGRQRPPSIELAPDPAGPHWWSVLDLYGAREGGLPLTGPAPEEVIPPVPPARVRAALDESRRWHDDADAASPNRVLNLARMIRFLTDGAWTSKPEAAATVAAAHPELADVLDEAMRARAEGRPVEPAGAALLSAIVADLLEQD